MATKEAAFQHAGNWLHDQLVDAPEGRFVDAIDDETGEVLATAEEIKDALWQAVDIFHG